jgi:hypothetical protein
MSRKLQSEDFIGTCQWCFGEFKVNSRRGMVLHGYTRPGYGYTVGNCRGVGHAPFEDTHELTDVRIQELKDGIKKHERAIKQIDAGKITKIRNPKFVPESDPRRNSREYYFSPDQSLEFYTPDNSADFDFYLKRMRASIESDIRFDQGLIDYIAAQVNNWKKGEIVGLDTPPTGRQRYVRDAYDPFKAKDEQEAAQRKAEREARPGKVTINFCRSIPFPSRDKEWGEDEWRAAVEASHDAEKAFKDEVKAWAKARFPGKIWVGDGDSSELRHMDYAPSYTNGQRMITIAVKPEWKYLHDVMEMFPGAHRYDKDTNRRDPATKHGIGKGKDIRIWVDGTKLPS